MANRPKLDVRRAARRNDHMARGYSSIPIDAPKLPPVVALRTIARVGRFVRPYRRQVVYAAIALVFAAAAVLAIGQGLKFVIDRGFVAGSGAELDRMLAVTLAVVVVMAVATYGRFYFVSWLGERVTADLRRAVFDHLLSLPPGYFELMRTGEVISRLTNDTTMLETIIGSSASMAIRNILLMAGGLVMLALTSAKLTLLVLVGVPLVLVPILFFGRRVRKLARASQDRVATSARTSTKRCTRSARCRRTATRTRIGGSSAPASKARSRPRSCASASALSSSPP
jgi:ABC-type multidrug transport system fused ATPase/permease subunit